MWSKGSTARYQYVHILIVNVHTLDPGEVGPLGQEVPHHGALVKHLRALALWYPEYPLVRGAQRDQGHHGGPGGGAELGHAPQQQPALTQAHSVVTSG